MIPHAGRQQRHPVRAGQDDRLAALALVDQVGPPVDQRRARDVAGGVHRRGAAVGPPAEVEDLDADLPEVLGRAIRSWPGSPVGPSQSSSVSYRRGRAVHAGSREADRGPRGAPRAVGRDLPEHRIGRSDAGRDRRRDGRYRELRARSRARPPRLLPRVARPHGRGPRRCGGHPRDRCRRRRPDPLDDRRDERRHASPRLARGRARRDDRARTPGRRRAALRAPGPQRGRADVRRRRRRWRRRPDARRIRGRDHARHPSGLDLARPVDDGGGHAGRTDRRDRARPGRDRRRRRGAGRRRDPVPFRGPRGGPVRASPPRNGCSGRRGWAPSSPVGPRSTRSRPSLGGSYQLRARGQRRRRRLVARRPALRGQRLPPALGRRDGALDRLAVDVRRPRLRPPARDDPGRRCPPRAWRPSRV